MSPLLQLKLLRVLQEREIRRLGDDRAMKIDVRLVAATNRDLHSLLATGRLREDFYYRIRVFEIPLPPLRERREDIPLLVDHFVAELSRTRRKPVKSIARDAIQRLMEYPWPGNVRELKNAIEHAFVTVAGDCLTLLDLPLEIRHPRPRRAQPRPQPALTDDAGLEWLRIVDALRASSGNQTAAAKRLGISRVTLWKKIRRFGINIRAVADS
jgi:transcriptional regulator with PAS, ATPase and Fis domain